MAAGGKNVLWVAWAGFVAFVRKLRQQEVGRQK